MWNEKRSLLLSKISVIGFAVALALALIFSRSLVKWLVLYSVGAQPQDSLFFYATFFTGGLVGFFLLYNLYRLLNQLGQGQVFTNKNIAYLRRISWACLVGAAIGLASAFYYIPWVVVAIAAAFVALIVRVVKNVLAEAILLKEENDYTI